MITLEETLISLLIQKHYTISTAESCTGGLLAGRLINVAGCSEVIHEGFITYSNEAKRKYLNVNKSTLEQFGAVSEETAREMAIGAAKVAYADVAITTTGIAGPDGGSKEKPVGTVYIGCFVTGNTYVKKCLFSGDRQEVRNQSVEKAIEFAIDCILHGYC